MWNLRNGCGFDTYIMYKTSVYIDASTWGRFFVGKGDIYSWKHWLRNRESFDGRLWETTVRRLVAISAKKQGNIPEREMIHSSIHFSDNWAQTSRMLYLWSERIYGYKLLNIKIVPMNIYP